MDFRLRNDGTIFVLEANANPNLAEGEDLARSAEAAGLSYDDLLTRILSLGLGYQAAWRSNEG
jgi:D-alanine-D-alanine ligase